MKCPSCGNEETSVKDSRICDDGGAIKRRRVCTNCDARFTTVERILKKEIQVIKKDGKKTLFDKDKVIRSISTTTTKKTETKKMSNIKSTTKKIQDKTSTKTSKSTIKIATKKPTVKKSTSKKTLTSKK